MMNSLRTPLVEVKEDGEAGNPEKSWKGLGTPDSEGRRRNEMKPAILK